MNGPQDGQEEGRDGPGPGEGLLTDLPDAGVFEVLARAVRLYRGQWATYAGTVALTIVPVLLLRAYLTRDLPPAPLFGPAPEAGREVAEAAAVAGVFGAAELLVIWPVLFAALTRGAVDQLGGARVSVDALYRAAARLALPVVGTIVLMALAVLAGLFAFVLPGIYLAVRLYVATAAVVVESPRPTAAVRRSWDLTAGHFGRVFAVGLAAAVAGGLASFAVSVPLQLAATPLGDAGWVLRGLAGAAAYTVVAPFGVIVGLLVYLDLRMRRGEVGGGGLPADLGGGSR